MHPQSLHWIAVCLGLTTWASLTRRTIYGDYALVGFTAASAALYSFIRTSHPEVALRLTAEVVSCYALSLSSATVLYRLSPFHPLATFPGPLLWRISSVPFVLASFGGHRHLVLDRLHEQYGKLVRIGPDALSVNSQQASNIIYGPAIHMEKSSYYAPPGRIPGAALFFRQSREGHAIRKQIWQQAFTPSALSNFLLPLERRTWQLMECIETRAIAKGVVNMAECLSHWAYDCKGEMAFGGSNMLELMRDGDPRGLIEGGKRATAIHDSFGQVSWLLDILWHVPAGRSMHYLRHIAASMMRTRMQVGHVQFRDLASYLLDGHPRTGQQIPLPDLELDAVVAIQGGSDGTGTVMTLAVYFILVNPAVYKALQTALDEAFPDVSAPLDQKTLSSIPMVDAILMEALRLGPATFMPRVVPPEGTVIEGMSIPGGTNVSLAVYSQHVSEENFFPDPLKFLPERWLPGGLGPGSITNKAAIMSFSTGPDVCIGKNLAMQEMRLCLARLVLTYNLELPSDFDAEDYHMRPRHMRASVFDHPLLVKVARREGKIIPNDVY